MKSSILGINVNIFVKSMKFLILVINVNIFYKIDKIFF
jgi:hypothetical protein